MAVPKWLPMPLGSLERTKAWIEWKKLQTTYTHEEFIIDGAHDLFRLETTSVAKQRKLFLAHLDQLKHAA